jgi:hypothetical protein
MSAYNDIVKVERCLREARKSLTKEAAEELPQMAKEHQPKAVELNGGQLPNIEEHPLQSPPPETSRLAAFLRAGTVR